MSKETVAGSLSKEGALSDSVSEFLSSRILDLQKEFTRYIEEFVKQLIHRVSNLEEKVKNESSPVVSSQSDHTGSTSRSEAIALDSKSESDGLVQQVLHLQKELNNTNARMKELEDLCRQTTQHFEDRLRNVVRKELEDLLKGNFQCIFENNIRKLVQEMVQEVSAKEIQNQDMNRGISQSSTFVAWNREESQDDSEETATAEATRQEPNTSHQDTILLKRDVKSRPDDRGIRADDQPKFYYDMTEKENLQTKTVHGMKNGASNQNLDEPQSLESGLEADQNNLRGSQPAFSTRNMHQPMSLEGKLEEDISKDTGTEVLSSISTRTIDQPMSLEGRLEGDNSQNTFTEMHPAVSARTIDQPMSLEGRLEGDTSQNTFTEMHPAFSTRTIDQPLSLEGRLEGDTSQNTLTEMHPAVSTRTIDQPMSLEGRLEGDTNQNTFTEMHPAFSTRTIDQPLSLEGRLEGDTNQNTFTEMHPAVSTRTIDQPMSLEGRLEEVETEKNIEKPPPALRQNSGPKPKVLPKTFRLFQKKTKKSSMVPGTGDKETGPDGASKAKESSKSKKS